MNAALVCYRCGHSLSALSLPISRRDECPQCRVELHVCRMCVYYAPGQPDDCAEDDAIAVKEKARANFCDYFKPKSDAYMPGEFEAEQAARSSLGALFGDEPSDAAASGNAAVDSDEATRRADDLFK